MRWGLLGSCGVAGLIGVRPVGRLVHQCSLGCDMGVVGFIRVRRVHWGAPWGSLGSYGVVDLRPKDRLVHPVSLDSLR